MKEPAHPNAALLDKLFTALDRGDHETMASCYHEDAQFRDIAFDREGREQIHDMWRMICSKEIRVKFEIVEADDRTGRVKLIDTYMFGGSDAAPDSGRRVVNAIESDFWFDGGRIRRQRDRCDAKDWAKQALDNPILAFLAGRIRWLRRRKANAKLEAFVGKPDGNRPMRPA